MDSQIVAIYCICDDILKGLYHQENSQCQMSDAEIMTTLIRAACDNYRIQQSRHYSGERWRGYQANKDRYFYGLKLHLMVTEQGQPVEFFLSPGS